MSESCYVRKISKGRSQSLNGEVQVLKKTICYGGTKATVSLDHPEGVELGASTIELQYPEGHSELIPVPALKDACTPSFHGRRPTMEELELLALLHLKYRPILFDLMRRGDTEVAKVVEPFGKSLPSFDGPVEPWLLLIQEAVQAGVLREPTPHIGTRH